jgi:endonuclease/exonuclease/phosphatase family metal-dependent hydrolase
MDRLHVATLNILNLADRWPERLPLLLADMAALQPDLLGLQEAVCPSDHFGISAHLEIG